MVLTEGASPPLQRFPEERVRLGEPGLPQAQPTEIVERRAQDPHMRLVRRQLPAHLDRFGEQRVGMREVAPVGLVEPQQREGRHQLGMRSA
jgi:hypothetical protein